MSVSPDMISRSKSAAKCCLRSLRAMALIIEPVLRCLGSDFCLFANCAGFDFSGAGVASGDGAGFAYVAFGKGEGSGGFATGEQLFALAKDDRVGHET